MKKENIYLVVSNDKYELPMCCNSNLLIVSNFVGFSKPDFLKSLRQDRVKLDLNCRFRKVELKESQTKGRFRIVLFESEQERRTRIVNGYPIITTLEDLREIRQKENEKQKGRLVKEVYEFYNFDTFLDYRADLIALGEKKNIMCFCEI